MYRSSTLVIPDEIVLYSGDPRPGGTATPTPLYVFGYAPTVDDLFHFADKHNLDVGSDYSDRAVSARRTILASLPEVLARRTAVVPVIPEDEFGTLGICTVLATNLSAKEMSLASNRGLIELLQKSFDTKEEPKWYLVPRRDYLNLR